MTAATVGLDEHTCHAKGCATEVEPAKFMCLPHWRLCPAPMREAIKALYRPCQEVDKQPSAEYLAIAKAAIDAVAHKESRRLRPARPAATSAAPAAVVKPQPLSPTPAKRVKRKPRTAHKLEQLALFEI